MQTSMTRMHKGTRLSSRSTTKIGRPRVVVYTAPPSGADPAVSVVEVNTDLASDNGQTNVVATVQSPAVTSSQQLSESSAPTTTYASVVERTQIPEAVMERSEGNAEKEAAGKSRIPLLNMSFLPLKVDTSNRPFFPVLTPDRILEDLIGEPKNLNEFMASIRSISAGRSGPVLYRPDIAREPDWEDPKTLPVMVYLPGVDGTGLAAYRQFPGLSQNFDLINVFIPPEDRSNFREIVNSIKAQLEAELAGGDPYRPVYLLGESFGGLVACGVASECNAIDRVILVNPATSFDESYWPQLGPALAQLPKEVYNSLPIFLAPILTNPINVALGSQLGNRGILNANPLELVSGTAWGLVNLIPELGWLRSVLPPETLVFRLQLLKEASQDVNNILHKVPQRVLLMVGSNDLVIPSSTEGPRLKENLPRCTLKVLEGRSHALLQEAGVDLFGLMDEEGFYFKKRHLTSPPPPLKRADSVPQGGAQFGRAAPIEVPTLRELQNTMDGEVPITTLKRFVSPVFLSANPDTGRLEMGLHNIPLGKPGKPVLLVGNHQLFAPDMPVMIAEFAKERRTLIRGLAHPMAVDGPKDMTSPNQPPGFPFNGNNGSNSNGRKKNNNSNYQFGNFLKSWGAVLVSPTNMHRLMQMGETILVYPGGVKEALKYKGQEYQIFWPDRPELVRMAARFGATIVPFGAVGAEDGVHQIFDGKEMMELPVVGEWVKEQAKNSPQARFGATATMDTPDTFVAPLIAPKLPARYYYVFQKPIETSPEMYNDREACAEIYKEVKSGVEGAIEYLLTKREEDPYKDLAKRMLFEASWDGSKQAPTFDFSDAHHQ